MYGRIIADVLMVDGTNVNHALVKEGWCWWYPRLFRETGLVGQVRYLEPEAAEVQAIGIGCFFDDLVHEIVMIKANTV